MLAGLVLPPSCQQVARESPAGGEASLVFVICNDASGSAILRELEEARAAASPFRVSVCAARTLNAAGQAWVTLSLRSEHVKSGL